MSHVLIVDDDIDSAESLSTLIADLGHTTTIAANLREARQQLLLRPPAVVLLDLHLPDGSGMDLFEDSELRGDVAIVLMTGQASVETSVQALRVGAADYLVKPINIKRLERVLARVAQPSGTDLAGWRDDLEKTGRFGLLWGRSRPMRQVYDQIARVAPTAVSVLLIGESGTGKEVVAQTVHDLSRRRKQPFLAVNCGAISPQLIESELFGHEKGSFTGAMRQHRGFFERAHGGTLFLDEITEMPAELQVKLLRVLETGAFMRVGSDELIETDVRILAASNRDPHAAVAEGKLREDLYYRLNVFQISIPPLRERLDDLPLLAEHFLFGINKSEGSSLRLSPSAMQQLSDYHWPGNVRELRNIVQRSAIMADGNTITSVSLPDQPEPETFVGAREARDEENGRRPIEAESAPAVIASTPVETAGGEAPILQIRVGTPIADAERALILATLQMCGGAKERTADLLGISLKTLYNRLRSYGDRSG